MKTVNLTIPVKAEDLKGLEIGSVIFLNGVLYTGREGLYKRIIEQGESPPTPLKQISNVNFHCSPAAAINDDGTYNVGAATGTASFRFSKWMQRWFEISDCKIIIGKGGMTQEDYQSYFVPNGAVYLTTVGYGTGALLGRGIKRVVDVHWLEELGIAQAMWVLEVEKFGPFLLESDLDGRSLFHESGEAFNKRLAGLYAGLKPPTMKRYGETTSREDEVI
jgi:L(+)-tartrate dehydratase beta subunit